MSKVIPFDKKNVQTISSRQIAEATGKQHQHVKRDIESMCEKMEWPLSNFGQCYINPNNGQEYTEYQLPRFECDVLVTGYDVKRRAAVIKRWYDLETGKATPLIQQLNKIELPANPHTLLEKNMAISVKAIEFAKAWGFEGNQAMLSADRIMKNQLDFSPLKVMGHKQLSAPVQEMTFTPTQLGMMMTPPATPREVNLKLQAAGMQEKFDSQWIPTDRGMEYCEILDTGKSHNSGTPVKQVKWFKRVLDCLLTDEPAYQEIAAPVVEPAAPVTDPEPVKRNLSRPYGRYRLPDHASAYL